MEEHLRNYFKNLGYFVVRSVKYKYEGNDITDVDLLLYGRTTFLGRQRINVDIKNKKTPQAFERILWANGLMRLLRFDSCIVATTDTRPVIHSFGRLHQTTIIDGTTLGKLRLNSLENRLSEEDLVNELVGIKSFKNFPNKDWRTIYELSKSRLLTELDFSGANATLIVVKYLLEKALVDPQKRETAIRMLYVIIAHFLVIIDYILKDISFLEQGEREKRLSDGFTFGNLGKEGVDKIIQMAELISENKKGGVMMREMENESAVILKEFFGKAEVTRDIFKWARGFELLCFNKELITPESLDAPYKSIISVLLDYFAISRQSFFNLFPKTEMTAQTISQRIEHEFSITHSPTITRVTMKNKTLYYGYFQHFDDYAELRKNYQYRFIPATNAMAFIQEREKTGKLNPQHSIILDAGQIKDIDLVLQ